MQSFEYVPTKRKRRIDCAAFRKRREQYHDYNRFFYQSDARILNDNISTFTKLAQTQICENPLTISSSGSAWNLSQCQGHHYPI